MNKIITYTCPYCGYQSNEDHEVCPACGNGESVSYNNEQKGFDQEYLQSCIDKASKSWKGVDVDKFMDEVRGREPVCEELEEEIKGMYQALFGTDIINRREMVYLETFEQIARHFVRWQKDKDQETIELAEDHAYLAGSVNEREKMMKEAVEGTYNNSDWGTPCIDLPSPLELERFDKVRIIIVKED